MNVFFKKKITLLLFIALYQIQATEQAPVSNPTIQKAQATPVQATIATNQLPPTERPIQTIIVSGKNEIPVGATLPLKGENAVIGTPVFDGMSLYFNKIKTEQLPFTYQLTTLEDQADVQTRQENIKALAKTSPIILSLLETEALTTNIDSIKEKNILALFPIEGSKKFRTNTHNNIIFFRANHEDELQALVDYSIQSLDKKKIAIFYEESEWGKDCLESLKQILSKRNIPLVAEGHYPQNTLNITKGAKKIVDQDPEAIVCVAHSRPAYNFIQHVVNNGNHKTVFLCLSTLVSTQDTLRRSRGISIVTSAVVPDPRNSSLPIAKEFREDMQRYTPNKPLSPFAFEGYINAALITECTKLIQMPITPQKIIKTLEGLKHVKFKGLEINFDESTRTLCKQIWINTGHPKKEWLSWPLHKQKKSAQPMPNNQVIP